MDDKPELTEGWSKSSEKRHAQPTGQRTSMMLLRVLMLTATLGAVASAQDSPGVAEPPHDAATSDVFRRFGARVVKVQVAETGSGARASIGSGFFVSPSGHVVTNYHVIASLINTPGRYRAELIDQSGAAHPVRVLAIDAVHDLAVLGTDLRGRQHFTVDAGPIAQGTRLFSLGHPRDLAISIVEGTYNGLHPFALYPRIHLTASLNPGMSGGPTIDRGGRVIGVNVSTAGEQVSFLVPAQNVAPLIARAISAAEAKTPTLAQVGRQLRMHQDAYLRDMFDATTRVLDFGPFRVLTQPAPYFRCWGDAERENDMRYETAWHRCATDDGVFLDDDQSTGTLALRHQLVVTKSLSRSQFFSLYTTLFGTDNSPSGSKEYVTSWECATRNVRTESMPLRAVTCLRRYRKLGELYDGFLQVAVLGPRDTGLVSTLNIKGATFENVTRLTNRFLQGITWR
jgi:S1-C subfamily serine protease